MTTYRTYSKTDIVEGETTLAAAQKTNARFSDIKSWFPTTASAAQYMVMGLASGLAGFVFTHVLRADAAVSLSGVGSLAAGDLLYYNGTNFIRLAKGTSGQLLSQGASNAPEWATVPQLTDGDKTDITVSSSGTVWTIDNSAISTAKIAAAAVTQAKIGLTFSTKTTTYTAVANDFLFCDTSSAAWTLTFPASASVGDWIYVNDYSGTFDSKNLTINPNGLKIESQTTNLVLDIKNFDGVYYYTGTTVGWRRI